MRLRGQRRGSEVNLMNNHVHIRGLVAAVLAVLVISGATQAMAEEIRRPHVIAVLPFKNLKADKETDWVGAGAAETVTTKLVGVPGILTVERTEIQKVLAEQAFRNSDMADPATAVKVGRLLGAGRIVVGTFFRDSGNDIFNVHVVDVETTQILNAVSLAGKTTDIFEALTKLAESVVESFDKKVVIVDARPVVKDAPQEERVLLTEEQKRLLAERGTTNPQAWEAAATGANTNDLDERIAWYTKAIALDPGYVWAYNNRGNAYVKKREYDRAIEDFDRAIQFKPDYAMAYNNRGLAYDDKKDYDRAIQDYDRAIQLKLDHAETYNNRGVAYANKGQYYRAIQDYDRAIQLKLDLAEAYNNRGNAYVKRKEYDRAIQDYDWAIQLEPDDAAAYYNRGGAYYFKKEYDKAWADVKTFRKLGGVPDAKFIEALTKDSGRSE
jgi:tetratricopeptide (TPR) repeat protein